MLGLPSTTEVRTRLPKEAFYRNLKLKPAVKDAFVHKVESVTVRNTVKQSTTNVPPGNVVAEIMVVEVELRQRAVPQEVLRTIAAANQHKLVFACRFKDEICLAVLMRQLVVGPWMPAEDVRIEIRAQDMDAVWDSLASQIVFEDAGKDGTTVEQRYADEERLAALREEIRKLDARCRKEKQFHKKNELFAQVKALKEQLAALEKGN